jgi:membrane protease YdiL (CAAX protease family)
MSKTQRNVLIFFLLSFPLTWWGFALAWLAPSMEWAKENFPLGPLIAAPIAIWFTEGREGVMRWLRRLGNFRAPPWVYAVSFFVPLGLAALCGIFAIASGARIGAVPTFGFADLLLFVGIMLIAGPLPEEVTFRGYGQHELQNEMTVFTASLWIGLGVLIWHLPLLLWGELPWQIAIAIIAVSVVYAWLYVQGGSVWPLLLRNVPDDLLCGLGGAASLAARAAIGPQHICCRDLNNVSNTVGTGKSRYVLCDCLHSRLRHRGSSRCLRRGEPGPFHADVNYFRAHHDARRHA